MRGSDRIYLEAYTSQLLVPKERLVRVFLVLLGCIHDGMLRPSLLSGLRGVMCRRNIMASQSP